MKQLTPDEEDPEFSLRVFFRLLLKQFYANSFSFLLQLFVDCVIIKQSMHTKYVF